MRNIYNNFIYAELIDSDPLDDVMFYSSFSGWRDPMALKFAKIIKANHDAGFYKEDDVVLINPSKIAFYESEKLVVFRNDAIICGYDNEKKRLAPFNYDVVLKIDDKSNDSFDLMMLNASINQAEVFIGTIFDIHESDLLGAPMIGDKVIVAQSNTTIDVNKVPFEFKKLSDKNGKFIVTDTRNIIARF
jgi:hypothetical protein